MEAKYRSMASITCELKWLKELLLSLGANHPKAIPLLCDSQFALHIAKNLVFHECIKHIKVDCHFIRDAINEDPLRLSLLIFSLRLLTSLCSICYCPSWTFLNFNPSHAQT